MKLITVFFNVASGSMFVLVCPSYQLHYTNVTLEQLPSKVQLSVVTSFGDHFAAKSFPRKVVVFQKNVKKQNRLKYSKRKKFAIVILS